MSDFKKKLIFSNLILFGIYIFSKIIYDFIPPLPDVGLAAIFSWNFLITIIDLLMTTFSYFFAIANSMLIIVLTIYEIIPKKNINIVAKIFAIAGLTLILFFLIYII